LAAYLGVIPESLGLDVGAFVQTGVVVATEPWARRLSRTNVVAVLAAGGLAQQRIGVPAHSGSGSDEDQIEELRLGAAAVANARRRASEILELVWPDVLMVADQLVEHTVLSGETALSYVLFERLGEAAASEIARLGLARAYASAVDRGLGS
jgi:hypothetical protein